MELHGNNPNDIFIGESAMQYSKVEICGVDTSKLRVLKEKEKLELLKKIREGDKSAREKLINGNLRLVLSVSTAFYKPRRKP